jgi:hypothetical protein
MAEITGPKFSCPSCGKEYKWKPELAGKKGKCKCGGVLSIPARAPAAAKPPPPPPPPPPPEEDAFGDSYDVADEPVQAAPSYTNAPTTAMSAAPTTASAPRGAAASAGAAYEEGGGGRGGSGRELKWVPALKWMGIGAISLFFALWELASPTDPDAPGRKRGIRAIMVLANKIHPQGAVFVFGGFAAFMIIVGLLVLLGKVKDSDHEHEEQQGKWPASRGKR